MIKSKVLFFLFLISSSTLFAQYGIRDKPVSKPKQKVGISADSTNIVIEKERSFRELFGHVVLKSKDAVMYCNYARQDVILNTIDAYGKIRIVQGDTTSITGDTLFYDAENRFAKVKGNVVVKDRKVNLTTHSIDYQMRKGIIIYPEYGKIIDAENTLTSNSGRYSTKTKRFNFKEKVEIVAPKYNLTTDSMDYDSKEKIAIFKAFTTIKSESGLVFAAGGTYNTESRESNFKGRSWFDTKDYLITGDTLDFNGKSESGIAKGNVELISKQNTERDKIIITGQVGIRNAEKGLTTVYGNPLLRNMKPNDTLYLRADTLVSYENKKDSTDRKLIANRHVKIYKSDIQANCDSLIYNMKDSVLHLYKKPILWSSTNQLESDSMTVVLIKNKAKNIYLKSHSFVIAADSILNYNQIKGRRITVNFDDSTHIEKVFVDGNGESIYYALDDKKKIIGMNRVECGRMTMNFKDSEVKKIVFQGSPDAQLFPPGQISSDRSKLPDFEWKEAQKPTKEEVLLGKKKTEIPSKNNIKPSNKPSSNIKPTGFQK
jgi:lipopolysaccharide export system protein LptA